MTGRAVRLRRLLTASLAAGVFLITSSAGAAQSGVTVTVQDNYQADYGVTIPFTRSPRTTDYTFSLYEGGSAAGTPAVSAKVEMTAAQGDVYLPLAYDITGPQSYTLKIEARPLPDRIGTDTAAAREFSFTTKPTCGCASGTAGAFYRGSGSAADPFYVGSQQQLAHVSAHARDGSTFLQTVDIDLAGNAWQNFAFIGTYDGGGHVVRNLKGSYSGSGGLFASFVGTLMNLGVENANITTTSAFAGALVGSGQNVVIQCCYAKNCTVSAQGGAGGILGDDLTAIIEDCYEVGGSYTCQGEGPGGIAGNFDGNQAENAIRRCYAIPTRLTGPMKGILAGKWNYGEMVNCYFPTNISCGATTATYKGNVAGSTGLPLASFSNAANFSGWDFANVWRMDAGAGRPVLRVFDNPKDS